MEALVYNLNLDVMTIFNCPHDEGTKIVCKHMVALYFEIFSEKANNL